MDTECGPDNVTDLARSWKLFLFSRGPQHHFFHNSIHPFHARFRVQVRVRVGLVRVWVIRGLRYIAGFITLAFADARAGFMCLWKHWVLGLWGTAVGCMPGGKEQQQVCILLYCAWEWEWGGALLYVDTFQR